MAEAKQVRGAGSKLIRFRKSRWEVGGNRQSSETVILEFRNGLVESYFPCVADDCCYFFGQDVVHINVQPQENIFHAIVQHLYLPTREYAFRTQTPLVQGFR